MAEITIRDMRVNHIENPVGYEMSAQTFSWKYEGDCAGEKYPKACRVMVARDSSFTDVVSDSGFSLEVSGRAYCLSLPLAPRTRYYWRAEAQLAAGGVIRSDVSFFETGKYLEAWQGRWIRLDAEEKEHTEPFEADLLHIRERAASPVARRAFAVAKEISAARLYVTGLGLYECYVNGVCANDGYLQPGFNHYNYWQQYQTFDVTGLLRRGENVLAFLMGDGWYKGRFGVNGGFEQNFGAHMHLLCELRISYADGTEELVASDGRFRCAEGPVKFSSIYDGEVYDASAQPQGAHIDAALDESTAGQPFWMCPGFDDSGWRNAKEQAPEKPGKLTERYSLPVVVKETLKPQAVLSGEDGAVILDMGQNMTGWLVFRDMLKPQQQVRVRFAELLKDGRLCTDNLLSSAGTSFMYTSDGAGRLVRPHFTYFGFRYAELSGFPEDVRAEDFEGWCLYSDLPGIGQLATGNAGVNRLISNILWSQRGNFLEHPTDCPQRAERLGWTGDAQIYCRTAGYFMDTAAFFRKYLKDVNEEQAHRGGIVPFIIPKIRGRGFSDPNAVECSAAWSDVATVMPWTLYVFGGDKNLLAEHYAGMKAWADYMAGEDEREGGNFLWKSGFHFGDWLALDNPEPGPFGKTDPFYIASAYYYYSTSLTAKAACVLGMDEDAERYGERAKKSERPCSASTLTRTGSAGSAHRPHMRWRSTWS